jgi:hypothetical protein
MGGMEVNFTREQESLSPHIVTQGRAFELQDCVTSSTLPEEEHGSPGQ